MKKHLRAWLVNSACLAFITELYSGLEISQGIKGRAVAGLGLTLINLLIRPILKTILLPINLLTLGTLKWLIDVFSLGLLVLLLPQITLVSFHFSGLNLGGITIHSFNVPQLASLMIISLSLVLMKKAIKAIFK